MRLTPGLLLRSTATFCRKQIPGFDMAAARTELNASNISNINAAPRFGGPQPLARGFKPLDWVLLIVSFPAVIWFCNKIHEAPNDRHGQRFDHLKTGTGVPPKRT